MEQSNEFTASTAWLRQLRRVVSYGKKTNPRGKETLEILGDVVTINMAYPVVFHVSRGLSYNFMASEAFWIISGSNLLDFSKQITEKLRVYSNDGITLDGAYGPPFMDQLSYVVDVLKKDQDSRQAVISVWRPRPYPSKDIPCTVAIQFIMREGSLNSNVFMRSSDVWLGLPYDLFTFSIMTMTVALLLEVRSLGRLKIFMGSSHLYEENFKKADELLSVDHEVRVQEPWNLEKIKNLTSLKTILEYASSTDNAFGLRMLTIGQGELYKQ